MIKFVVVLLAVCIAFGHGQRLSRPEEPSGPKMSEAECVKSIGLCLRPLEPHRQGFTRFKLETIPQLCRDFTKVQQCLDKDARECESTDEWRLLQTAFGQICEPGKRHGVPSCARLQDVVTRLRSCEREELKGNVQIKMNHEKDHEICQVIEEYVNCYTVTVDNHCAETEGRFVRQVMSGVSQVIQLDKEVVCVADRPRTPRPSPRPSTGFPTDAGTRAIIQSWGPLSRCMGKMASVQMSAIPGHKHESLDELCMHATAAKRCGSGKLNGVTADIQNKWDQFLAVVNYVCVEKRAEFQDVYECLVSNVKDKIVSDCYKQRPEDDMEDGSSEESSEESSEDSWMEGGERGSICRMVHDFEDCAVRTVSNTCGRKAGQLVKGLADKMDDLLAREHIISCPYWTYHRKLFFGLVGGGCVLVIIMLVLVCVACRRRRRSKSDFLDKKHLVKHDLLQANLKLEISKDGEKGLEALSVSTPKA